MIMTMLKWLPKATIVVEGKAYLTRYYLFLRDWKWFNIYFHHFHSSDQGDELHNHPWRWAISFIFRGGYWEEIKTPDDHVVRRLVKAPTFNFINNKHYHRVDLLDEQKGSWSIFFAGPRSNDWGFWNRHTNKFNGRQLNPGSIP
jgi:hypothetical protein